MYILNTIHFSSIVSAKMYADNFPYITDNVKKFRELLETKYKDTIEIYDERPKDKTVDTESRYFYLNLLPLPEDSRYKRIQIRISDHPKNYSKFKSEFNIAINDMVFSISPYENPVEKVDKILDRLLHTKGLKLILITLTKIKHSYTDKKTKKVKTVTDFNSSVITTVGRIDGYSDKGVKSSLMDAFDNKKNKGKLDIKPQDLLKLRNQAIDLLDDKANNVFKNKPDSKQVENLLTFVTNTEPFTYKDLLAWVYQMVHNKPLVD